MGFATPFMVLEKIISEMSLKSSKGYICFTEAPLIHSIKLLNYFQSYPNPMYSKYAIGFPKDILYNQHGARPVIYGKEGEDALLDASIRWRFEKFDTCSHDYTWLREWRINSNCFDFRELENDFLVIVQTKGELETLTIGETGDIPVEFENELGHTISYEYSYEYRVRKGFAIEEIMNITDDHRLCQDANLQKIGEELA